MFVMIFHVREITVELICNANSMLIWVDLAFALPVLCSMHQVRVGVCLGVSVCKFY